MPPTTSELVQRRQQRCLQLIADISDRTPAPRRRPDVVFLERTSGPSRGRFSWRHDRITLVIPGFLDDPSLPDDAIDAVVAHEMGHWADPDVAAESRRAVVVGIPILMAGAALLLASLLLSPIPSAVAILAGAVACVAAFYAMACFSWPGEERADRFAVEQVGAEAVVAMLESTPKKAARGISPTHPSVRRRTILAREAGIPPESAPDRG